MQHFLVASHFTFTVESVMALKCHYSVTKNVFINIQIRVALFLCNVSAICLVRLNMLFFLLLRNIVGKFS